MGPLTSTSESRSGLGPTLMLPCSDETKEPCNSSSPTGTCALLPRNGRLPAWDAGRQLDPPAHAIWAKPSGSTDWVCEFLLNEADDTNWIYRRDHRVRYPLASLMTSEFNRIKVLPPEIVLGAN